MWCTKVLVAYDGSAPSQRALDLAREIGADNPHAEFLFVHVVKLFSSGTAAIGIETVMFDEAEGVMADMQRAADSMANATRTRLLKGSSPADLILGCAREEGCDLIIMGSRGQGGVKGYLGSVSYSVVQGSAATVLIAKGSQEARS